MITVDVSMNFPKLDERKLKQAAAKALYKVASEFQKDLTMEIENGSGEKGEPPQMWRGDLVNSVELTRAEDDECVITVSAPYALVLEHGSKEKHFYPFFDKAGGITILGEWARDRGLLPYADVTQQKIHAPKHIQVEWKTKGRPSTMREMKAASRQFGLPLKEVIQQEFGRSSPRGLMVTSPHPYVRPILEEYQAGKAQEIFNKEFKHRIKSVTVMNRELRL